MPLRRSLPEPSAPARPHPTAGRYAACAGLAFVAGLAVVGLLAQVDPGRPKAGRVLLDEYNSNWEWTTQALDTEWYGQKSGYNYYSLGQWLQYYYQVDTNFSPRTPDLLAGYDVLIIKTPTAPFTPEELDAIDAWVRAGGGLFLIGDHTNVFGTSSYLNPLARRFGLRFRYDSTYDLQTLRVTLYERPGLLAHPAVLEMPPFLFATSCTLEAPLTAGNVMVGYGLRALPVDYSTRVFFPDKDREQDYPFGLFLQSAAVQHGRGRVVAFTDSTVFSNFTMFIAGKSEYFLGVMNWLNHAARWPWLTGALVLVAALGGAGSLYLLRGLERRRAMTALLGALLLAAAVGPWGAQKLAEASYPLPEPHTAYTGIAFEGEHSRLALPTRPAASPPDASYQTFYVWTQRLGYVPSFSDTLEEALERGQVLVLVNPALPLDPAEMVALEAFVRQGGRLLVLAEPQRHDRCPGQPGAGPLWPGPGGAPRDDRSRAQRRRRTVRRSCRWPGSSVGGAAAHPGGAGAAGCPGAPRRGLGGRRRLCPALQRRGDGQHVGGPHGPPAVPVRDRVLAAARPGGRRLCAAARPGERDRLTSHPSIVGSFRAAPPSRDRRQNSWRATRPATTPAPGGHRCRR